MTGVEDYLLLLPLVAKDVLPAGLGSCGVTSGHQIDVYATPEKKGPFAKLPGNVVQEANEQHPASC
jgi:hypothetical protein